MANITSYRKGFVLAFSLLISSIVLALAFGIFNILLKQIVLTASAKDSQIAFYAADAGAECALYWDTHTSRTPINDLNAFDSNGNYNYSYTGIFAIPNTYPDIALGYPDPAYVIDYLDQGGTTFSCGLAMRDAYSTSGDSLAARTQFEFDLTSDSKVCAKVLVEKGVNVGGSGYDTRIQSRGYNDCNTANSRRVERAIEVKY